MRPVVICSKSEQSYLYCANANVLLHIIEYKQRALKIPVCLTLSYWFGEYLSTYHLKSLFLFVFFISSES